MNNDKSAARTIYAVIGSNSVTGSHFVAALLENPSNYVVGLSRSPEASSLYLPYKRDLSTPFDFYQVDLVREPDRLISLLDEIEPSYVINVAALSEVELSQDRPVEYFQTNAMGMVELCSKLKDRPYIKRYIHISTAEVYGNCDQPVKETAPLKPSTPYAASKAAADMYLMTLWNNFGFPVIIIRSTNIYGRHQQLHKVIPRALIYLKQGRKLELHSAGRLIRSYLHIRDVVRGSLSTIDLGTPGEIYNFSGDPCTIAELVKTICRYKGQDFDSFTQIGQERRGQDFQYLLDSSKAWHELGWHPQISLEEGIAEVSSWIDDEWERIPGEPLMYVHQS